MVPTCQRTNVAAQWNQGLDRERLLRLARTFGAVARSRRPLGGVRRAWSLLAASDQFEAWVIDWPSGSSIDLHDHGSSAAAMAVIEGTLSETRVCRRNGGRLRMVSRRLETGEAFTLPPGHVHDVRNAGPVAARSVHVYSPRLTEMTHYRISGGQLDAGRRLQITQTYVSDVLDGRWLG